MAVRAPSITMFIASNPDGRFVEIAQTERIFGGSRRSADTSAGACAEGSPLVEGADPDDHPRSVGDDRPGGVRHDHGPLRLGEEHPTLYDGGARYPHRREDHLRRR